MKDVPRMRMISGLFTSLALTVMLAGCTNEKKVFVERPLFTNPPAAAQGFLGYDDQTKKLTVCGNCHIGHQAPWVSTKHADAWADLQASGHASASCENCHTAGPNGNSTSGTVGWAGAKDTRYHDVQCESCHGPGLNHVTNPDVSADQPLASIKVLSISGTDTTFVGCAECHNGVHHPFVEDWAQSKHAQLVRSPSTRAECISCHTAQGALQAWGVTTQYVESKAPLGSQEAQVCVVCHDPHSSDNSTSGQLRFPIDVPDENRNLCVKCHFKRAGLDTLGTSTHTEPHSPEGPLLFGDAGWPPPGFNPQNDRIVATHGTGRNPKLCATCHVNKFDVTDQTTGAFVIHATGHLFEPIPCLNPQGKPVPGGQCDVGERSFKSCTPSGCHGDEAAARSAYLTAKSRTQELINELDGLLAQLPDSLTKAGPPFTTAKGAQFNAELAAFPGSPIHNPFLIEQLLIASINAVKNEYHLSSPTNISLDRMLK